MSINFTRFRSENPKVLTKSFGLRQKDGRTVMYKRAGGNMVSGTYEVTTVESLEEFSEYLQAATPDVAFAYGVPKSGQTDGKVTTKAKAKKGVLTRTENDIAYSEGMPGIMFVDYDPITGSKPLDEKNLVFALRSAIEAEVKFLTSHSASSWLYLPNGKPIREQGGLRVYWFISDASDIPRAAKALENRLWALGDGQGLISGAGSILKRNLIDMAVYQASRLDFVGGAAVADGIRQKRPAPRIWSGETTILDTRKTLVDRAVERDEAERLWQEEKKRIRLERGDEIEKAEAGAAKRAGVSVERFREVRDGGTITDPDFQITLLDRKGTVTVRQILEDPEKWHGTQIPDPLEPDYGGGRQVAIIYTNNQPRIVSQAHGGYTIKLKAQEETVGDSCAASPCNVVAERILNHCADELLYDPVRKTWYAWNEGIWFVDKGRVARLTAKEELLAFYWEIKRKGGDSSHLDTPHNIGAVESLLRDAVVQTSLGEWDQSLEILGVPEGVVDLSTGELRPERPEDRITKRTLVRPCNGAGTPLMDAFLAQITKGDPELIAFIWRLFGYALSGDCKAQIFPFITGPGGNGKSVLLNIMGKVFGDYAVTLMSNTLTEQTFQNNSTDFDLMRLQGVRLATIGEIPKNKTWNEAAIKSITGGDQLSARASGKDPITFTNTAVPIAVGNDVPGLRGVGDAMRRRIKITMLDFKPTIPDRDLEGKILREEASAITGRLILECRAWRLSHDLLIPAQVAEDSAIYLAEEDVFGVFLEQTCEFSPDYSQGAKDLYDAYVDFVHDAGFGQKQIMRSITAFGRELTSRGFGVKKSRDGKIRMGVRLRKQSEF